MPVTNALKQWRRRHPERVNAYRRQETVSAKKRALGALGWACVRCSFSDPRTLQIDHRNGGGSRERAKIGQHGIYRRVLRHPEDYQLLCANCNWIKRYENGERAGLLVAMV